MAYRPIGGNPISLFELGPLVQAATEQLEMGYDGDKVVAELVSTLSVTGIRRGLVTAERTKYESLIVDNLESIAAHVIEAIQAL